jgi:hypothetical protein
LEANSGKHVSRRIYPGILGVNRPFDGIGEAGAGGRFLMSGNSGKRAIPQMA